MAVKLSRLNRIMQKSTQSYCAGKSFTGITELLVIDLNGLKTDDFSVTEVYQRSLSLLFYFKRVALQLTRAAAEPRC